MIRHHFILLLIYEWGQCARVLHYTRLERLTRDKISNLLVPFVIYEANEVLKIQPPDPIVLVPGMFFQARGLNPCFI